MSLSKVSLKNNPHLLLFGRSGRKQRLYDLHQATPIYQVIDATIHPSNINMHKLGACGINSSTRCGSLTWTMTYRRGVEDLLQVFFLFSFETQAYENGFWTHP
jgi:hypothetical protein